MEYRPEGNLIVVKDANTHGEAAPGREVGSLIAVVFAMVFVIVNSGGLDPAVRAGTLVIASIVAVVTIILVVRSALKSGPPIRGGRSAFGKAYWIIVVIEAVALFGGARVLSSLGVPELGVAWVSFVVGTHFFALGWLFALARFHALAVVVTVCGLAGFVLAWLGAWDAIALVSGVVTGFVLLAFALWAMVSR